MDRRLLSLVLPFVALISPAPAVASSWANIGKNTFGSTYDVDWDSIRRDGNMVTFTIRTQYGPGSEPSEEDGYVAIRQANCANRTYADLHTDYMKNGQVLNSTGAEGNHNASAGSIAALVLDKVCAK
jgi:hypothetical protein